MTAAPRPPEAAVDTVTWQPYRWSPELLAVLHDLPTDVQSQWIEDAKRVTPILGGMRP